MLDLKVSKSFKSILSEWERLYRLTPDVSPFLHPEAISLTVKYFYPYYLTKRCRPLFLLFCDDRAVRAIAPMLKYTDGKMQLWGFPNGFNESGMLFDSEDILPECFSLMKSSFGDVEFLKIDERSPVAKFVPSDAELTSNAEIKFGDSFDEYFNRLSKSVRQNMRTAYNRLSHDGHDVCLKVFCGGDNMLPIKEIISLYCSRHEIKYSVKTGPLKRWFLRNQSFATRFYRHLPNAMTFALYVNGNLAAFLSGLSANGRLSVPRLSIDETYKRYSPGMLLVIEVIKHLVSSSDIRVLDLSQGKEPYKYNLGATEHFSYRFNL